MSRTVSIRFLLDSFPGLLVTLYMACCLLAVALAGFTPGANLWALPEALRWMLGIGVALSSLAFFLVSEHHGPADATLGIGPAVLAAVPLIVMASTLSTPPLVATSRWPLYIGSTVTLLPCLLWTATAYITFLSLTHPDPVASSDTPD